MEARDKNGQTISPFERVQVKAFVAGFPHKDWVTLDLAGLPSVRACECEILPSPQEVVGEPSREDYSEPWNVLEGISERRVGYYIVDSHSQSIWDNGDFDGGVCDHHDARRIVACVNALVGVSTADLESGALQELLYNVEQSKSWLTSYPGHGADAAYERLRISLAKFARLKEKS